MKPRRTSQILVLLVGLFGVLAFVCAGCASRPKHFPNGITFEEWLLNAPEPTEFPKLSEP